MKKLLLSLGTVALVLSADATLLLTNTVSSVVPDNNYSGWASSINVSGQSGTIQEDSLKVNLNLTGGWNGDLYAYLVNSSGGFAVLLDRVGYNGSGYGFGASGMSVTLTDTLPGGSVLDYIEGTGSPTSGGIYSRDGYAGSLGSFVNPNGTWTLFVADLSGGGVTTVSSWGLQMDIVAVPEVETWIAAALAGAFGAFWLNRQIWSNVKKQS